MWNLNDNVQLLKTTSDERQLYTPTIDYSCEKSLCLPPRKARARAESSGEKLRLRPLTTRRLKLRRVTRLKPETQYDGTTENEFVQFLSNLLIFTWIILLRYI